MSFLNNVKNDIVAEASSLTTMSSVSMSVLGASAVKYYYSRDLASTVWVAASSLLGTAVGQAIVSSNYVPDALVSFAPIRTTNLSSSGAVYFVNQYLGGDMRESALIAGANYIGSVYSDIMDAIGM